MKYLSLLAGLFLFIGMSAPVQAQTDDAISKYFSKYVDDERFTVVYVSGKMFEWFKGMDINLDDEEAEAALEVIEEMKGLRILTCEENAGAFYKEAMGIINKNEYEVLLEVREGKETNVLFLTKEKDKIIDELLLVVGEEDSDEFVLMSFMGKIHLDKIGKLAEAIEKADKHDDDEGENNEKY